jgi:hypothetical protein
MRWCAPFPRRNFSFVFLSDFTPEWQSVLTRPEHLPPGQTSEHAMRFLRYLASQAHLQ